MKPSLARGLRGACACCALLFVSAAGAEVTAPSPFPLLAPRALTPPLLDVTPICLPGSGDPRLEEVVARAARADLEGARHRLASLAAELDIDARRDAAVSDAILAARIGGEDAALRAGLLASMDRSTSSRTRACARLELARLELRNHRLPEASAELRRARRELESVDRPAAFERTARFYAAEIAVLDGRRESAGQAYQVLATSDAAWLAQAARLRLADLDAAWPVPRRDEEAAARWARLRAALEGARRAGVDPAPWSARAAEVAIAAGDLEAAHRWLADAERIEQRSGVASIRKADVLVALERGADARKVLDRVASAGTSRAARDLASVRRAGYGVGGESTEQRVERLLRGAASLHPHVAAFARYELARVHLAAGDTAATLEALARLAYTGALPGVDSGLARTLDRAVREAAPPGASCEALLERLGGRRSLFIGLSNEPEPFLRLGDCFLKLGMPGQALDIYRQLARRFGRTEELGIPLRVARASFAANDLPILRASLRAYFADPTHTTRSARTICRRRALALAASAARPTRRRNRARRDDAGAAGASRDASRRSPGRRRARPRASSRRRPARSPARRCAGQLAREADAEPSEGGAGPRHGSGWPTCSMPSSATRSRARRIAGRPSSCPPARGAPGHSSQPES